MNNRKKIGQLDVAIELADFINEELLPKIERDEKQFWMGFEKIIKEFSPRNAGLLLKGRSCSLKLIHGIKSIETKVTMLSHTSSS